MITGKRFSQLLRTAQERKGLPSGGKLRSLLEEVLSAKERLPRDERPRNRYEEPGGLLYLPAQEPAILLPDLHGRREFLWDILEWRPPLELNLPGGSGSRGTVLEELEKGALQLVSLGDLFHAEGRAVQRWKRALSEYRRNWKGSRAMDEEMKESLGTAETLSILMARFPRQVHVLKGNHENITNHEGGGDHPFVKYAEEGRMVQSYMEHFYGTDTLYWFFRWEQQLPLLAVGSRFLVSHAAPRRAYRREEIINRVEHPQVTEGLIWTGNGEGDPDAVETMLTEFLGSAGGNVYITGHRPIRGRFLRRGKGLHLQFHNPGSRNLALIAGGDCPVEPERDMIEL